MASSRQKIVAIIPAYNEEATVGTVVEALFSVDCMGTPLSEIIVVDNASTDGTAAIAEGSGARVVKEAQRGYGAACLKGIAEAADAEIVLFADADGADSMQRWPELVRPIIDDGFDLVIGARPSDSAGLLAHQRFGNSLATFLMGLIYGKVFTDLGPFRAIKGSSLKLIDMKDVDYGWTVEMQLKALRYGLKCHEISVSYGKRDAGRSKVAGTVRGTIGAAYKILGLVGIECLHVLRKRLKIGACNL